MSRKHYIEVAKVIQDQMLLNGGQRTETVLKAVAESLADMFKQDNPRFDRSRFMDACGLGGAK